MFDGSISAQTEFVANPYRFYPRRLSDRRDVLYGALTTNLKVHIRTLGCKSVFVPKILGYSQKIWDAETVRELMLIRLVM